MSAHRIRPGAPPEFEATRPEVDEEGAVEVMKARREEAHAAWCDLNTPHAADTCPEVGYDAEGVFFKRPVAASEPYEDDEPF